MIGAYHDTMMELVRYGMRNWLRCAVALLCAFMSAATATAQQPTSSIDRFIGTWEGTLQAGATRLRIGLTVERDSLGGLRGVLTSIDQGEQKIPASFTVHGDTLAVSMPLIHGSYAAAFVSHIIRRFLAPVISTLIRALSRRFVPSAVHFSAR